MVHYFIYQRFQFCLVKRSAFQQNFADGQHFTLADVGDLLRHQAIAVCGSVKLHTLDKSLARCLLWEKVTDTIQIALDRLFVDTKLLCGLFLLMTCPFCSAWYRSRTRLLFDISSPIIWHSLLECIIAHHKVRLYIFDGFIQNVFSTSRTNCTPVQNRRSPP